MNYPSWVLDATPIPTEYLVWAKKALYVLAACEKLRVLHNAAWKWANGQALTAQDESLLRAAFPQQWPTRPTLTQARQWLSTWWEPRQEEAQSMRAAMRRAVAQAELDWVDLKTII